jgi:ABC-type Fe3+-hydroxamate transport system substrate-binding protein
MLQIFKAKDVFGVFAVLAAYLWAGVYTYYQQLTEPGQLHQEGQLQNMAKIITEEKEEIVNPEEIREAYAKIEYNIQQNQSYAAQNLM